MLRKEKLISSENIGDQVFCDICGKDYSNSTEEGGMAFGSKAYCPTCAESSLPKIKDYGEERFIRGFCPPGMTYRDWVVNELRGGKPGIIEMFTMVDDKEDE